MRWFFIYLFIYLFTLFIYLLPWHTDEATCFFNSTQITWKHNLVVNIRETRRKYPSFKALYNFTPYTMILPKERDKAFRKVGKKDLYTRSVWEARDCNRARNNIASICVI